METNIPQLAQAMRHASSWQQAIYLAVEPLQAAGYVTEHYYQGVIDNTLEWGPYYVVAPGVALPHARPEQGACNNAIAFTTLAQPVTFGHDDCDPVWLMVALSATDAVTHLTTIQHISTLLQNAPLLSALRKAATDSELFQLIK